MYEVKHEKKLLADTMKQMAVNITYLQDQLKGSQEKAKTGEEENIIYLGMIGDAVQTIAENENEMKTHICVKKLYFCTNTKT